MARRVVLGYGGALTVIALTAALAWSVAGWADTVPGLPGVALSSRAAGLLGVRAGGTVALAPTAAGPWRTFRVARVYQPAEYPTEVSRTRADIRLHLPDLQALLAGRAETSGGAAARRLRGGATASGPRGRDDADSIVVRVRPPARPRDVAASLDAFPLGFRAYTSRALARRGSATFDVIERFHRAISAVTLLASGVFLLTIMTLRGEEMRRQIGVLRVVGLSRRSVAAAVLLIAAGVALAGSAVGVGAGYLLSSGINAYYRSLFDTDLVFSQITPSLLGGAVALSVLLGIAAGSATAWRLLRQPPLRQIGR